MDIPTSVLVLNKFNELEKPTLKNKKGAAFQYFLARYKETYGFNYTSPSIPGDIRLLGELISAHSFETVIFILEMYVATYDLRFKTAKYPFPKVQGLRYKVDLLVSELNKTEVNSEPVVKSDLGGIWANV